MPFLFIILGLVLVVAGVRGTVVTQGNTEGLYPLLLGDLTGSGSFEVWIIAILIIGGLGYIKDFEGLSRAFLALVVLVLFLSNGGFFQKFQQEFPGAFGQ
jgi:hypothetical protein